MPNKTSLLTALLLTGALLVLPAAETRPARSAALKLRFSENQPLTVSVTGTVRDNRSGNPVPGALVRAHIVVGKYNGPELFEKCPVQQAVSDPSGFYQISFVTPLSASGPAKGRDSLCVYASAPGYGTQPQYVREALTIQNTSVTNLDFQLEPGKKIRGILVDPAGQPVADASVRVQNSLNGDWNFFGSLGRTVTAADGSFELWIAAGGDDLGRNLWLCILKPGAGSLFVWNLVAREDLGTLTLNSGGKIAGRVVGPTGAPGSDCEVSVRIWPCDLVCKTVTDQEGKYLLTGVPGEPAISEFFTKKNGSYNPELGRADVYARLTPDMNLKDAPHCQVTAKDGQTVTIPDLVAGADASVSGALLPSKTAFSLGGLLVRLDDKWENMVEADINGQFRFPFVPAGKHTLTAYLPHNLRYDRGIGKTSIEVQSGKPLKDVQIQLADLAELRVRYLDAGGNPLPGISASATWSKNGDGAWTEGTVSDSEGWAVLYLYPGDVQYIRGFDRSRKLTAETAKEINPQPAQILPPLQLVMVATVRLSGRLLDAEGHPFANKPVLGTLNLADGTAFNPGFKTDTSGRFQLEGLTPGILRLSFEISKVEYNDPVGKPVEARPGQTVELGDLVLKNGLDKPNTIKVKHAQALDHPQEIKQAAQDLFERIRTAKYDDFLKDSANWQPFPIVGFYQTHKRFDFLVKWMSQTFKTNPITRVEISDVFANPQAINGHEGLPAVSYKLTLKDDTVLKGNLPFEYNFDGGKGHWHGLEGIDWHLQNPSAQ